MHMRMLGRTNQDEASQSLARFELPGPPETVHFDPPARQASGKEPSTSEMSSRRPTSLPSVPVVPQRPAPEERKGETEEDTGGTTAAAAAGASADTVSDTEADDPPVRLPEAVSPVKSAEVLLPRDESEDSRQDEGGDCGGATGSSPPQCAKRSVATPTPRATAPPSEVERVTQRPVHLPSCTQREYHKVNAWLDIPTEASGAGAGRLGVSTAFSTCIGNNLASDVGKFSPYAGFWCGASDGELRCAIRGDGVLMWRALFQGPPSKLELRPTGELALQIDGTEYTATLQRGSLRWSDNDIWIRGFEPYVGHWFNVADGTHTAEILDDGTLVWSSYLQAPPCRLRLVVEGEKPENVVDDAVMGLMLELNGVVHTGTFAETDILCWSDGDKWERRDAAQALECVS
eukprot:TRINITY_DN21560_c0_g1_i1.p1 TRINITY_DN21560_c0_g1~~TRINITY_DN21560_c0_g1_i1.p1  ORF type:complete len:403 (-),score=69.93 TRINITY_DN21560_c0_g1_i1:917-2125(-)